MSTMLEHRIEDGYEFAHAGDQRELLGFAALQQTAIKGTQRRVITHAYQRCHVERGRRWLSPANESQYWLSPAIA